MPSATLPMQPLARLRDLIAVGDLRGALRFLNDQTPHRFTGLYVFEDPTLSNLQIIDKQDPDSESLPDVPVTATYCAFTRSTGGPLAIRDARREDRWTDHPARDEIISYCGVPLVDDQGAIFGTICHYDYGPVEISPENVELLEAVSALLIDGRPR